MLKHLEIENYALIEHLSIDFDTGLSILTGETGAGKSIIMGALSLILGQRADVKSIQDGKKKCVVEALFEVQALELHDFFEQNDLDYADETHVRREVLDSGKSRAFINDTPVNLNLLKEFCSKLIDVHSQHANLLLSDGLFQLNVVDSVAQTHTDLLAYSATYAEYTATKKELDRIVAEAQREREDSDYVAFQLAQLQEAHLEEGQQEELEAELDLLNHSEEVKRALTLTTEALDGEQQGACSAMKEALGALRKIVDYLPQSQAWVERLESCRVELSDLCREVDRQLGATDFNPNRKVEIEERLNTIYTLQQKHRVSTVAELLQLQASYEERVLNVEQYDDRINALKGALEKLCATLAEQAVALTHKRQSVCQRIAEDMDQMLHQMGMLNAHFTVEVLALAEFTAYGKDRILFQFAPNKNSQPKLLSAIASGGEMSRVMLALKSLIATQSLLPTIIFDEIDTGVSGEVAHRMGEIMRRMSGTMQVISITHLPQIAAKGNHHYKVYKTDTEVATHTNIVKLSNEERVNEIAELLSGKNPSAAALDNARELLAL